MKTVSAALAAHLAGEVTTLATCWRLERTDGWVRGFTDHDRNLVIDGVTYVAATGFLPSAIKSGADLSVDNLDVDGFLDDEALKAEDLTAGLFDGARIDIFLVNWADLSQGRVLLRRGWLGEVKRADNRFSAEIRGIANRLQQVAGKLYSRLCRTDLGSAECKVVLGPLTDELAITAVSSGDTPAYWRGQAWQHERLGTYRHLRLGHTLADEVAACVLGGFGMKAELGLAAFARLRDRGLLQGRPSEALLECTLAEPFVIHGRTRRYRFPRQKSRYLAACLNRLSNFSEPKDDVALRNQLAEFPGIGLKTASWIVRNYRASNYVAVVDIHILRAGRHIGLFPPEFNPQRHYCSLEDAFIRFADALGTGAGMLDGLIWDYMRRLGAVPISRRNLFDHHIASTKQSN